MTIYIKNMVCRRCIMVVKSEVEKLGLTPLDIRMGELELKEEPLGGLELQKLDKTLHAFGFERIDDKKSRLIQRIKDLVIQRIHHTDEDLAYNWSGLISGEFNLEYNYISHLFSSKEGITLEQFIIRQKVEKIKELLLYDELTLGEIAWKLGYSSPAYLSNQFRKVTGMTPGEFRNQITKNRRSIDEL